MIQITTYTIPQIVRNYILLFRIPVPDIFGQRNCRRKRLAVGTEENNTLQYEISDGLRNDLEEEYLYNYDEAEYHYDTSNATEDCDNARNFNLSDFEEIQKNTYKDLPRNVYCDLVNTLETHCFEQSILEIWMYNENLVNKLTKEDIIYAVNKLDRSPYFGFKFNYSELLGSVERNKSGHIISAKATIFHMATVVDLSNIKPRQFLAKGAGPQLSMDESNIVWQDGVLKLVLNHNQNSTFKGKVLLSPFATICSFCKFWG